MKKILFGLLVGALLTAAVMRWVVRPSASASDNQAKASQPLATAGPDPNVANLRGSLEMALGRIDALERVGVSKTETSDTGRADAGQHDRASHKALSPEEQDARLERMRVVMNEKVTTESRDPTWAPANEAKLRSAADKSPGGATIKEIVCKTSVCRVELAHADQADQTKFLETFRRSLPEDTQMANFAPTSSERGGAVTVCHIFRRGFPLPEI